MPEQAVARHPQAVARHRESRAVRSSLRAHRIAPPAATRRSCSRYSTGWFSATVCSRLSTACHHPGGTYTISPSACSKSCSSSHARPPTHNTRACTYGSHSGLGNGQALLRFVARTKAAQPLPRVRPPQPPSCQDLAAQRSRPGTGRHCVAGCRRGRCSRNQPTHSPQLCLLCQEATAARACQDGRAKGRTMRRVRSALALTVPHRPPRTSRRSHRAAARGSRRPHRRQQGGASARRR